MLSCLLIGGGLLIAIVVITSVVLSAPVPAKSEGALFRLNSSRTSDYILSGAIETYTVNLVLGDLVSEEVRVSVYYEFELQRVGVRIGTFEAKVTGGFGTKEAMQSATAQFSPFCATLIGKRDVQILGTVFPQCDVVKLTDLKSSRLKVLVEDLLQVDTFDLDRPQNVVVTVALHGRVPALHIVQVDIAATVGCDDVKAGFDLCLNGLEV